MSGFAALAHGHLSALIRELHGIHELVDQEDPAPSGLQDVLRLAWVGDDGMIESGSGIPDHDDDLSGVVDTADILVVLANWS